MPRHVDHKKRRRDILDATVQVIAEHGLRGLSFRAVAAQLGGSTTMVTHYYPTQADLIEGLADSMIVDWEAEVSELEQGVQDPYERLAVLLTWLVPTTEEGRREERARIGLLAEQLIGASSSHTFDAWESRARKLLQRHLEQIVPRGEVAMRVDTLRALTNGLALSVVEHPDHWTKRRVLKVLRQAIADMGLGKPD